MYKKLINCIAITFLVPIIFLGCSKLNYKDNKGKVDIPAGVESVTEITPLEADVNEDTIIGVDVATLNYASDDRIVFHGNFGLFIYDLNTKKVLRGIDVNSIGCGYTQGDNVCIVSVSKDGNTVSLHPASSQDMYIYDVEKNTLIKTKYEKLEDELETLPMEESYYTYDEEYTYSYIKLIDGEVSYLKTPKSNMAMDMQYIKNDKVYDIFK